MTTSNRNIMSQREKTDTEHAALDRESPFRVSENVSFGMETLDWR